MIDDSALLHGRVYDPAKAREYYLRTRQLKGRKRTGTYDESRGRKYYRQSGKLEDKRRQNALEEQKEALEARLARLKDILAQKVEAAKKRSGVETKAEKKAPAKKSSPDTANKKDTPLTNQQKREKAEKAREEYEKESKGPSVSQEIAQLQKQILSIRKQIAAAMANANKNPSEPKNQTASNGR